MTEDRNPTAVRQERKRADQLQFLRFLAFLNIFIMHTEEWLRIRYPVSHCGRAAVSFFFILSGLVTGYSLYGKEISLSARNWADHMRKKLVKIYPLYFLTVLLAVMYSPLPQLVSQQDIPGLKAALTLLAKNLLMIQSWFPNDGMNYNASGWFISTVFFLYFFNLPAAALLNKAIKSRLRIPLLVCASLGIAFFTVVFCYVTQNTSMGYWHNRFPVARLGEYLIGMIWGFLVRMVPWEQQPGKLRRWVFTALEIFALYYWIRCLSSPGNYWRNYIISWLRPNILLLVVFTLGQGWISWLFRRKPLVFLGDISFECYLLHGAVIKMYRFQNAANLQSDTGKSFLVWFCLLFTILLSSLLHRRPSARK